MLGALNINLIVMYVCVLGGDTVVPSPRGTATVQLRHTGRPVERRLHLRRNVQKKVRAGQRWSVFSSVLLTSFLGSDSASR